MRPKRTIARVRVGASAAIAPLSAPNPKAFVSHRRELETYLLGSLFYPPDQVVVAPSTAVVPAPDALVFRDRTRKRPISVVYLSLADGTEPSVESMLAVAHLLDAEYCFAGTPKRNRVWRLGKGKTDHRSVTAIPVFAGRFPRTRLMPRELILPPWRDEHDLRSVIRKCHNELFSSLSHDPAAAYDEMLSVLLTKVYDEVGPHAAYEFAWLVDQSDDENSARIRALARRAARWIASAMDAAEGVRNGLVGLDMPTVTLRAIVQKLQDFSVMESARFGSGTDVQGVVYETIVGSTFRGELGSYFTPRNIVEFMIKLAQPSNDCLIFDPACGTGGFLVGCLEYLENQGGRTGGPAAVKVYGVDINPRMVRTAQLSLLLKGQNPEQICYGDGLHLERNLRKLLPNFEELAELDRERELCLERIRSGPFDIVLANPPFAGFEKDPDKLRAFISARREDGSVRSANKVIPFVEAILASTKEGGMAGIVVPISVLNGEEDSFRALRRVLVEHSEVFAIVGLPKHAFTHTDTGIEGALLFLRRRTSPRHDYEVSIAQVDSVGYDRLGKPTKENDLRPLADAISHGGAGVRRIAISDLITADRFDPHWWLAQGHFGASPGTSSTRIVPLSGVVQVRLELLRRRELVDDETYRYFEVRDCDIDTGEIKEVHQDSGYELKKKGRIRQIVRAGDILLPNHRDSLVAKSAAGSGRSVVVVGPDADGVLTTDRFVVLRPLADSALVVALLNSRYVREQLVKHTRGSASLDFRPSVLERVLIPSTESPFAKRVAAQLSSLSSKASDLRFEMQRLASKKDELISSLFANDE